MIATNTYLLFLFLSEIMDMEVDNIKYGNELMAVTKKRCVLAMFVDSTFHVGSLTMTDHNGGACSPPQIIDHNGVVARHLRLFIYNFSL